MTSTAGRAGGKSALLGATATGRERGSVGAVLSFAPAGATGRRLLLTIGAGWGPACKNSTLAKIMMMAHTPTTQPTASRWLHPQACSAKRRETRRPQSPSVSLSSPGPARRRLLRSVLATELHPFV